VNITAWVLTNAHAGFIFTRVREMSTPVQEVKVKIPRRKFIVIEDGEIKSLKVGEKSRMRQLAEEYAKEFGGIVLVDQDGDYVIDLDRHCVDLEQERRDELAMGPDLGGSPGRS